ncbi:hypothetical protein FI206_20550 [Salmonella enterica subsp. enterica]|nr:hypothetical protein [Salmonella enterica subsp. enterica serovar Hessarek]
MGDLRIESKLTSEDDSEQKISVNVFKITDIPGVMDNMGWVVAAEFMRKWFYDPYYEMKLNEKLNKVDMSRIDSQHIVSDLDFDWLFTASKRIKPIFDKLINEISVVEEFNYFLGRKEQAFNQLSNGLCYILNDLDKMGYITERNILDCYLDFSKLTAMELDAKCQFNFIRIGSTKMEKAMDDLDDVYGALGSFIIKVAFTDLKISHDNGYVKLEINELGFYIRDTYEFMNDGKDQLLGYWGENGVVKPGVIDVIIDSDYVDENDSRYYKVTNNSFVAYRDRFRNENKTGDFFVYSTVKKIATDIVIHLSEIDLREYFSWKNENV